MCLVGVYSVNSSFVDLYVLALVIGPMMETALRESLMINQGAIAPMIFRPIAGTIYLAAALALAVPLLFRVNRRKPRAF
jgi:TctA family transporter